LHNTTDTPLSALQENAYKTSIAELHQPNAADDDVQEIPPPDASKKETSPPDDASKKEIKHPNDSKKSEPYGSQKRKRGRPRKNKPPEPTNPVKDQFATNTIVGLVEGRTPRKSNPGRQMTSPYKEI
jgi:hypothetical protein